MRELGIAADFGLSSLTIPKQLLKGKNAGNQNPLVLVESYVMIDLLSYQSLSISCRNKTKEPPLPYPPPPAFIPLVSTKVDDQIGLLKPFYLQRLSALGAYTPVAPSLAPGVPRLPGPAPSLAFNQSGASNQPLYPGANAQISHSGPSVLPDDVPDQLHTKIGPLGQILKPSASAAKKSKSKAKAPPPSAPMMLPGSIAGLPGLQIPHPQAAHPAVPGLYLPPGMVLSAQAGRLPPNIPMMNGTSYGHMNGHGTSFVSGGSGMNGRPTGGENGAKKKTKK